VIGGVHERAEFVDGSWYLTQLACGTGLEDVWVEAEILKSWNAEIPDAPGLVVFQHPEMELYQRLVTGISPRSHTEGLMNEVIAHGLTISAV
jgi:hypothetical protein